MNFKPILFVIIVLSITVLACGVSFDLPITDVKTGPNVTQDISIEAPQPGEPVYLTLAFGAGKLNIENGAGSLLVQGTASYNVPDFKPEIIINGSRVRLETGNLELSGIPTFNDDFNNEWDLMLGDVPMNLVINSGAYQGNIDLGGLSL
ncbi:MAG: toast rack family protein, partial [Anaerolineales bacterium]